MARPRKNFALPGQRFGRLTVIGEMHHDAVRCRCECGNEGDFSISQMLKGQTVSCGCWRAEKAAERKRTHDLSARSEYFVWNTMRGRCHNPKDNNYKNYGGRGIVVCERWRHSFEAFFADMGPRPTARHTIDRRNNNGGYEPGNCRWATMREQTRNTRRNLFVEFRGEKLCLKEIAERTGTPYPRLFYRMTHGWRIEAAVSVPSRIG